MTKRNILKRPASVIFFFILLAASAGNAQEYKQYIQAPGIIDVQSTVSDGRHSVKEIAARASEKGVKIVVLTDSFLRRWEYGIWPLRNLVKRKVEESSVLTFGIKNYFKKVHEAQEEFSNLVILPAFEVSPFYFWHGDIFKGNLGLNNWHEQMLVVGLSGEDSERLPVVSHHSLLPNRRKDLIGLWPVITVFLGIWLARIRLKRQILWGGQVYSFYSSYRYIGYLISGVGLILLANNLFFPVSKYDQYHGNQGINPYQDVINYVDQRGGMTFWIHPRADYSLMVGGINVFTPAYINDLISAYNYTGFSSLYQDGTCMAGAGEEWDQILIQYCRRRRERPVWGIGELDYHGSSEKIDFIQTVFLLPQLDEKNVLLALKNGRMYAKANLQQNDFYLDKFAVNDAAGNKWGQMGDEVACGSNPKLYISGSCSTHPEEDINLQLIRGGELIKTFQATGPKFDIQFEDEYFKPGDKTYYRLNIESPHSIIVSNPIFVQF